MEKPLLVGAIEKLALAGEQAGFSVEQMIQLLDCGLTVETLLDLIAWRLGKAQNPKTVPSSSAWIV